MVIMFTYVVKMVTLFYLYLFYEEYMMKHKAVSSLIVGVIGMFINCIGFKFVGKSPFTAVDFLHRLYL